MGNFGIAFSHANSWENPGNEVVTLTFAAEALALVVDSISFVRRVYYILYATSISNRKHSWNGLNFE